MSLAAGVGLLLASVPGDPATAQHVRIESTDPAAGAVSVPLQQRVEFRLSRPLPPFGTAFIRKFNRFPERAGQLSLVGHALDENDDLTVAFWTLEHQPNTDFIFLVYGVQAGDGSRMQRPYVLNYTTASSWGPGRVNGVVSIGERLPRRHEAARRRLSESLRRVFESQAGPAVPGGSARKTSAPISTTPGPEPHIDELLPPTRAAEPSLERSVVLLLEHYDRDPDAWAVRGAVVPDVVTGAYSIEGVRAGTYYPVVVSYAGEEGELLGTYGFFDPDGDRDPDPIVVGDGSVADVNVTLFPFEAVSARTYLPVAQARATALAPDARLLWLSDLPQEPLESAADVGRSFLWRYTFYTAAADSLMLIDVDPINLRAQYRAAGALRWRRTMPDAFIDSDRAVELADAEAGNAFRAQYGPDQVIVSLEAGDLDRDFRPPDGPLFWEVTYRTAPEVQPEREVRVFVDMETGAILEGAAYVSTETGRPSPTAFTLAPGYPNPFRTAIDLRFTLEHRAHVTLRVYDILGREVRTLADGLYDAGTHSATWRPGALPAGAYLVRLDTPSGSVTQRVVRLP